MNGPQVMLAGRDIGLFVGMLTMGATWVGGGFINGSAQETYSAGLIWTQAPFGYACSLFISEFITYQVACLFTSLFYKGKSKYRHYGIT